VSLVCAPIVDETAARLAVAGPSLDDPWHAARRRAAVEADVRRVLDERAAAIDAAYREWQHEQTAKRLRALFGTSPA
jgi:hypothetical protein